MEHLAERLAMKEAYILPNILASLRSDVVQGVITLEDAAEELCDNGWMSFLDLDKASRLLDLKREDA